MRPLRSEEDARALAVALWPDATIYATEEGASHRVVVTASPPPMREVRSVLDLARPAKGLVWRAARAQLKRAAASAIKACVAQEAKHLDLARAAAEKKRIILSILRRDEGEAKP